MHGKHAVRIQMPEILGECLKGQQMDRDRIARKGVDDQNIELLRWLQFQLQARVAEDDFRAGGGA